MIIWFTGVVAFGICLLCIPLVRIYCYRTGRLAIPRDDRWHKKPTPSLGGVAIFTAFVASLLLACLLLQFKFFHLQSITNGRADFDPLRQWGFLAGSVFIFGLGLYDDFKHIPPPAKLVGQIIAATIVVTLGYTSGFFTPRFANNQAAQLLNVILTFIWLVGITNAINLLDNMDGLASGISLITVTLLGFMFWRVGNYGLALVSAALAGSLIGFLLRNYPPASIFMGDSGSMFIGFTLASLAIARQPQASNVVAILGVPTLLFMLPILDTILVIFTRLLRGESPVRGGRDHTSHRLIAFGLKERQALWVLYSVALFSGIAAIAVESIGYWLSIILIPVLVIALALATAYLGGLKVTPTRAPVEPGGTPGPQGEIEGAKGLDNQPGAFARVMLNLTYKRRLLEVVLDFVIIVLAFYLAFVGRFGLLIGDAHLAQFVLALPVVVAIAYLSFFLNGVYRGVWRYVGLDEIMRYFKASASCMVVTFSGVYFLYSIRSPVGDPPASEVYPPALFILFAVFLFLGLAASRSSFRIMDRFAGLRARYASEPVLIYGAGDAGEMALRWILMNPQFNYRPIGFIDNDLLKMGRNIHGVMILGGCDRLEAIFNQQPVKGLIIALGEEYSGAIVDEAHPAARDSAFVISANAAEIDSEDCIDGAEKARRLAIKHGCWVRHLRLKFELVE